jgi:Rrf2 family protein
MKVEKLLLTKECDYGIRIVRGLANGLKRSVGDICEGEHIPLQYAYKILKKLEHSGIVKSYRGPSGGYSLVKKLSELSLLSIVTSIEENILLLECMKSGFVCSKNSAESPCTVHTELSRLQKILTDAMAERSMAEILRVTPEKN